MKVKYKTGDLVLIQRVFPAIILEFDKNRNLYHVFDMRDRQRYFCNETDIEFDSIDDVIKILNDMELKK